MSKYKDTLIFAGGKMIYGTEVHKDNTVVFRHAVENGENVIKMIASVTIPQKEFANVIRPSESFDSDKDIDDSHNFLILPAVRSKNDDNTDQFTSKFEEAKFTLNFNNTDDSVLSLNLRYANVQKKDHPKKDHPKKDHPFIPEL